MARGQGGRVDRCADSVACDGNGPGDDGPHPSVQSPRRLLPHMVLDLEPLQLHRGLTQTIVLLGRCRRLSTRLNISEMPRREQYGRSRSVCQGDGARERAVHRAIIFSPC